MMDGNPNTLDAMQQETTGSPGDANDKAADAENFQGCFNNQPNPSDSPGAQSTPSSDSASSPLAMDSSEEISGNINYSGEVTVYKKFDILDDLEEKLKEYRKKIRDEWRKRLGDFFDKNFKDIYSIDFFSMANSLMNHAFEILEIKKQQKREYQKEIKKLEKEETKKSIQDVASAYQLSVPQLNTIASSAFFMHVAKYAHEQGPPGKYPSFQEARGQDGYTLLLQQAGGSKDGVKNIIANYLVNAKGYDQEFVDKNFNHLLKLEMGQHYARFIRTIGGVQINDLAVEDYLKKIKDGPYFDFLKEYGVTKGISGDKEFQAFLAKQYKDEVNEAKRNLNSIRYRYSYKIGVGSIFKDEFKRMYYNHTPKSKLSKLGNNALKKAADYFTSSSFWRLTPLVLVDSYYQTIKEKEETVDAIRESFTPEAHSFIFAETGDKYPANEKNKDKSKSKNAWITWNKGKARS